MQLDIGVGKKLMLDAYEVVVIVVEGCLMSLRNILMLVLHLTKRNDFGENHDSWGNHDSGKITIFVS